MCDYSLEMYHSRPASSGERYVLHRFRSGTLGFIDPADCSTAVCMPAGARLRLEGISRRVQQAWALAPTAVVVMVRPQYRGNVHRDGLRLADGRELLPQSLDPGVSAVLLPRDLKAVLDLKAAEPVDFDRRPPAPVAAPVLQGFAGYLARLRLWLSAGSDRQAPASARHLSASDA
jgi:hypothetical protein